MLKYADELRVGDVWTERPQGRPPRSYRAIAISPGLGPTTIRVTGECVATGRRRRMNFFLVNRVEARETPRYADEGAFADQLPAPVCSRVGGHQEPTRGSQDKPADPKKAKGARRPF